MKTRKSSPSYIKQMQYSFNSSGTTYTTQHTYNICELWTEQDTFASLSSSSQSLKCLQQCLSQLNMFSWYILYSILYYTYTNRQQELYTQCVFSIRNSSHIHISKSFSFTIYCKLYRIYYSMYHTHTPYTIQAISLIRTLKKRVAS